VNLLEFVPLFHNRAATIPLCALPFGDFSPKKKDGMRPTCGVTYHKDLGIFIPLSFSIHCHIEYFSRNLPWHNLNLVHSSIFEMMERKRKRNGTIPGLYARE
jgi:hypothetical protein